MSFPIDKHAEAEAQLDRLRARAEPPELELLDKFRALFVAQFVKKIDRGWVPTKGWATPAKVTTPRPKTPAPPARPVTPVAPELSIAQARRIMAIAYQRFREDRQRGRV